MRGVRALQQCISRRCVCGTLSVHDSEVHLLGGRCFFCGTAAQIDDMRACHAALYHLGQTGRWYNVQLYRNVGSPALLSSPCLTTLRRDKSLLRECGLSQVVLMMRHCARCAARPCPKNRHRRVTAHHLASSFARLGSSLASRAFSTFSHYFRMYFLRLLFSRLV